VHSDHIAGDPPGPRRRADVASSRAACPQPGAPSPPRARGGEGQHRDSQRLRPRRDRVMAMVLLGGIAAALMGFEFQFRHLEAYAAAHLYSLVTPTIAASSAPIIWFGLGSPGAFGLVITPDCSSALLIAPLCLLGVVLLIPRKLAVDRVMKALAVAAVILVAGNLTRIGVIALAIRVAGIGTGYQVGHLVLGSLISIICIAVSLALLTVIITARDGEALWAPVTRWYRKAAS
jgi:exosortase/archaeosortase family protein